MALFDLDEVRQFLSTSKKIVITTHVSPDGDAIGSSIALSIFLGKLGHKVQVITPDEYPSFLHWLPQQENVLKFSLSPDESKEILAESEVVFCLDFNTSDRMGKFSEEVNAHQCTKILIDHHQFPEQWTDFIFADSTASSTAELVYRFIESYDRLDLLDKQIGEALYAGIVTDTGSFKFSSTSAETMRIGAAIMDLGVDTSKIQNLIYDTSTEDRLRLLGYALTEKLIMLNDYHTAIIGMTQEELKTYNYRSGDTEGIVNYPLSIAEIRMSVFISQKNGEVRMSFRSKGDVPVHVIAKEHFSGGGHKNAAGGISDKSVEETIKYLESILESYKEFLC